MYRDFFEKKSRLLICFFVHSFTLNSHVHTKTISHCQPTRRFEWSCNRPFSTINFGLVETLCGHTHAPSAGQVRSAFLEAFCTHSHRSVHAFKFSISFRTLEPRGQHGRRRRFELRGTSRATNRWRAQRKALACSSSSQVHGVNGSNRIQVRAWIRVGNRGRARGWKVLARDYFW
jgi:hypothetical protein